MQSKKSKKAILTTRELLLRMDFFHNLSEPVLTRFESFGSVHTFQKDETISLAGDARRTVFFITKGTAKIYWDSKGARSNILRLLSVGDFFGEIQLFNESGKSYFSVKAEEECTVIIFKGKDFLKEISNNTRLSLTFLKEVTNKLSQAYMQISIRSMSTIKGKIKSCLFQFIEESGVRVMHSNGNYVIKLRNRPTQQQIAEMSGTTRETVNRELSELIKNGYIELSGKALILLKELPI